MIDYRQIFIVGVSRTGSKFYMQILNSHPKIYIAPEMVFKHPVKKDLYSILEPLKKKSPEDITIQLFESNIKDTSKGVINSISKSRLTAEISKLKDLNPYKIFEMILMLASQENNKSLYGAKFPVHYKYFFELLDNFPNSKILFLTRDPRDIYLSDSKKKKKEIRQGKSNFPVRRVGISFAVLFYTIYEWYKSLEIFEILKDKDDSDRVRLFRYENILIDQQQVIYDMADFLNLRPSEFSTEHLRVMDSSFNKKPKLGRWENEMSSSLNFLFKLIIGRKMNQYGYK